MKIKPHLKLSYVEQEPDFFKYCLYQDTLRYGKEAQAIAFKNHRSSFYISFRYGSLYIADNDSSLVYLVHQYLCTYKAFLLEKSLGNEHYKK
jgi:hypothetical protein